MVQSKLVETVKGKLMPQLPGSACAADVLGLILGTADLMQLHAALLSALLDAADAKVETPLQHAVDGLPLPLLR